MQTCFKVLNGVTSNERDFGSVPGRVFFVSTTKHKLQKDCGKSFDLAEFYLTAPICMLQLGIFHVIITNFLLFFATS